MSLENATKIEWFDRLVIIKFKHIDRLRNQRCEGRNLFGKDFDFIVTQIWQKSGDCTVPLKNQVVALQFKETVLWVRSFFGIYHQFDGIILVVLHFIGKFNI